MSGNIQILEFKPHISREKVQNEVENDTKSTVSLWELFKAIYSCGFTSYGGPWAHIVRFKEIFHDQKQWISEVHFKELLDVCTSLPGSESVQLLIALGSICTNKARGGFMAFVCYALPSAIFMYGLGIVQIMMVNFEKTWQKDVQLTLHGFQAAAVGVVLSHGIEQVYEHASEKFDFALIIISGSLFLFFQNGMTIVISMIICGALNLAYYSIERKKLVNLPESLLKSEKVEDHTNDLHKQVLRQGKGPFGKISLYTFLIVIAFVTMLRYAVASPFSIFIWNFLIIGTFMFGGSTVGIPFMFSVFTTQGLITDDQFWTGYSIMQILPGPLLNVGIYVGSIAAGVTGGIIGWVFLFLPSFLFIWGVLPYWKKYKNQERTQKVMKGIIIASIGLILASVILLWKSAGRKDMMTSSLISIVAFVMIYVYDNSKAFTVIVGGMLEVCRHVVILNVRGLEYRDGEYVMP